MRLRPTSLVVTLAATLAFAAPAVASADDQTVTPSQALSTLQSTAPDVVAPSVPTDAGDGVTADPSLDTSGGQLDVTGNTSGGAIATDPSDGFTLGTGADAVSVSPVNVAPDASNAKVVNGDSALYADTSTGADTVVRPVFDGIETYTQIRDSSAPEDYSWSIDSLTTGQTLELAPGGGAEVVDAAGNIIAAVNAPTAQDANGTSVPTWFTVDGSVLTMHVAHREGNYAYPIVADPHWVWRTGGCLSEGHTRTVIRDLRTGAAVGDALSQAPIPGPVAFAIERGLQVLSIGAGGFAEHMDAVDRNGGHRGVCIFAGIMRGDHWYSPPYPAVSVIPN